MVGHRIAEVGEVRLQRFHQAEVGGTAIDQKVEPVEEAEDLKRYLFLVAWHLFLIANIVTTSKALVPSSVALVSNSEHCYY